MLDVEHSCAAIGQQGEKRYKNNSQRTCVLLHGCPEDDTIFIGFWLHHPLDM
jgi:hypothetical protein